MSKCLSTQEGKKRVGEIGEEKIMKSRRAATVFITLIAFSVYAAGQEPAPLPPPVPNEELPVGAEALTSGPVHEAFAEPVTPEAQAGVMAPKPPPPNIQEVPPAQRPEGPNVVWVPGYWGWDNGRNDYIWVSGCWRVAPPNMCWVPGYWSVAAGGWEWVAGFWQTCRQEQEIEYLPAPPATVEVEPPGPAPGANLIWVPGCWYWQEGRYVLRHGYWLGAQADWVWVPSHYSWTPHGYVFCAGHWDYDMDARGVLFTPVYFPPAVVVRPGFTFSPSICVDLGILRINLFTYPRYCHYYFGDCYDDVFLRIGIFPWFECERYHTWYDPILVYDRWRFGRENPRWEENERHLYDVRRADPVQRPPRTFAEQQTRLTRLPEAQRHNFEIAQPLRTFTARTAPTRFETINNVERQRIATQSREVHTFRESRIRWESRAKGPAAVAPPAAEHRTPTEPPPPHAVPPTTSARPVPPVETHVPTTEHGMTPPTGHVPTYVPPHEVHVTLPERVKTPPSPITHRPVQAPAVERPVPMHPSQETSHTAIPRPKGDGKDDGRGDGRKGR